MKMKRLLWGFLMIAAVALTGCGSDGDGGKIRELQDMLAAVNADLTTANDDLTKANDDLATANDDLATATGEVTRLTGDLDTETGEVTRLTGELATATGEVGRLTGELTTATGEATRLEGELTTATGEVGRLTGELATEKEEVGRLTGELDTETGEVTRLTGDLTTATGEVTRLTGELATEKEEVGRLKGELAMEKEEVVRLNDRIKELEMPSADELAKLHASAIKKAAGASPTDLVGTIKLEAGGKTTVDDYDILDMPQETVTNEFEGVPGATRLPLSGFKASVHQREETANVTDTLTVYTDVEANKDATYDDYYSTDNAKNLRDGVEDGTAAGVLKLRTGMATGKLSLFSGSGFPTAPNTFLKTENKSDTIAKENEFNGTFNTVPGKFVCAGVCTATTDSKSELTITGEWTFTPLVTNLTKIVIPGIVPDADFLSFGYWVQVTTKDDGSSDYVVDTFAMGAQKYDGVYKNLTGKATYNGSATGLYVKKTFNPDGANVPSSSGQFMAEAELTAYFGQKKNDAGTDTIADDLVRTIRGTVSNFMNADGEIDKDWMVELKPTSFNDTNGAIVLGETTGDGEWTATFYGTPDQATPRVKSEEYPNSVAGEFDAEFGNGQVIGAFGATR